MFYELFYEVDIPAKSFVESEYGLSICTVYGHLLNWEVKKEHYWLIWLYQRRL